MSMEVNNRAKYCQYWLKNQMDFWIALVLLTFLLLPFCIIGLVVKLNSKGPVFFKMLRVGKLGRCFICYKFRTMVKDAQKEGLAIEVSCDDNRITRVGKILRRWSVDEIPQLINVLKGEMSLVGPRPALPHQVEKYSEFEIGRLKMKPGITGWAQVNGRNFLSWKDRIKLDVWYVENWSLWLDFRILLMTPKVVSSTEGLYGKGGIVRDYE